MSVFSFVTNSFNAIATKPYFIHVLQVKVCSIDFAQP
jgi:hypothetical protein